LFQQAEQGKEDLINTAEELRLEKIELEKTVAELRLKFDQAEKRAIELREAEEKKYMEEIQFLKKTNLQLKVTKFDLFLRTMKFILNYQAYNISYSNSVVLF